MNERIEKLAWQAMDEMDPESFSEDVHIPTEWYQKFAELIVRECLGIIDEEGSHEGGSIRSMEAIKEHFGVEE